MLLSCTPAGAPRRGVGDRRTLHPGAIGGSEPDERACRSVRRKSARRPPGGSVLSGRAVRYYLNWNVTVGEVKPPANSTYMLRQPAKPLVVFQLNCQYPSPRYCRPEPAE